MFGMVYRQTKNAIELLKLDHEKVKDLFDQFEATAGRATKIDLVRQAISELKIHAAIEEELFYPAVRRKVGESIMNEADEEHHVAKLLIAELEDMDGTESHYDGKFRVLVENVRHHIEEEEADMLPKAEEAMIDFSKLGEMMLKRRRQLLRGGTPKVGEERMVEASNGRGDSPAKHSHKRIRAEKLR
jgi:hemerythrin superfamily protein